MKGLLKNLSLRTRNETPPKENGADRTSEQYWSARGGAAVAQQGKLVAASESLGDGAARALASALARNVAFSDLDLSRNSIGPDGAAAIGNALGRNRLLRSLSLSRNPLRDEGVSALAKGLKLNTTLETLVLSACEMECDGAKALADLLLVNTGIRFLDVSMNPISVEGAQALADILAVNKTIGKIEVNANYSSIILAAFSNRPPRSVKGQKLGKRELVDNAPVPPGSPASPASPEPVRPVYRVPAKQPSAGSGRDNLAPRKDYRPAYAGVLKIDHVDHDLPANDMLPDSPLSGPDDSMWFTSPFAPQSPPAPVKAPPEKINGAGIEEMRALREETDLERRKRQEEIELLKQELQRLRLEKEKAKDPYVPQGRAVPERPDAVRQQSSKIRIFAKDVQVDKGRKLGEGGFGIVYAGTIYETTRVAIKVIKAHDDFKVRRAFERELSTWEGLIHPNVLPLMAYCAEPPMMISEIVSDGNIRVFLEKHSWKAELGLDLLRQVATGMSFLHAKNVLHGDLTPRNILVENGVARIMDFGLSKVRGEVSKSTAGSVLGPSGTSGYMSPELYDDQPLRKPADVFAFSIISCEVVGQGDPPWGHSPRPLLVGQWIKNGRRPERPYEASDEVWSLITRCWHPEPWERPTFVEIVKEMNQIIVK